MISIITPTYNEKESIPIFIKEVSACLNSLREKFEIIIVDDSSPDGTAKVVKALQKKYPQLVLLKRKGKLGIGSAYFDGYTKAKGDFIIGIDADLSQSIETIPYFIKEMKKGKRMVVASRYLPKSKVVNISIYRNWGSKAFNLFTKASLNLPILDITHSYRGITKKTVLDIKKHITETVHPSFFIELTYLVHKKGYAISEVPTVFIERRSGVSKLNTLQGLKKAIKTIQRLKYYET